MRCSKCGTPIPEGAAFCPACGEPAISFNPNDTTAAPEQNQVPARSALAYAGFWLRAVALVLDTLILTILLSPLVYYLFSKSGLPLPPAPPLSTDQVQQRSGVIFTIEAILFVAMGIYYSLLESSPWQATIGKKLFGLKVTGSDGRRVSFGRATARYFAKLLSNFTFLVGYFMAGFTRRKQALHDLVTDCLVIRERRK